MVEKRIVDIIRHLKQRLLSFRYIYPFYVLWFHGHTRCQSVEKEFRKFTIMFLLIVMMMMVSVIVRCRCNKKMFLFFFFDVELSVGWLWQKGPIGWWWGRRSKNNVIINVLSLTFLAFPLVSTFLCILYRYPFHCFSYVFPIDSLIFYALNNMGLMIEKDFLLYIF